MRFPSFYCAGFDPKVVAQIRIDGSSEVYRFSDAISEVFLPSFYRAGFDPKVVAQICIDGSSEFYRFPDVISEVFLPYFYRVGFDSKVVYLKGREARKAEGRRR